MTDEKMDTVTNRNVIDAHNALANFGQRKMGSVSADIRVARLLDYVAPVGRVLEKAKNEVSVGILEDAPDKPTALQSEKWMGRVAVAQAAFDAEAVEASVFEWPTLQLCESDLPKDQKGDEGWKNSAALGLLIANLGPLFKYPDSEDS